MLGLHRGPRSLDGRHRGVAARWHDGAAPRHMVASARPPGRRPRRGTRTGPPPCAPPSGGGARLQGEGARPHPGHGRPPGSPPAPPSLPPWPDHQAAPPRLPRRVCAMVPAQRGAGAVFPEPGPREDGSAAPRSPRVRRPEGGRVVLMEAAGVPVSQLPAPHEVAAAVRVAAPQVCLWMPPDAARPRTHTPRAHALAVRYFPAPDPASGRGPAAEPRRQGVGARGTPGSRPPGRNRAPTPQPLSARGLGPRHCHPAARGGSRRLPARGGRGGVGGAGGRGLRAERRLGSAPGKVWTWETPSRPPRREEGARGGQARAPGLPLRREARPQRRPPSRSRRPGGSLPDGQPPLGGNPTAPPAAPRVLTSGSGPGLPPVLPPRDAACGERVRSPAAARRSRRESGREKGEPRRRVRASSGGDSENAAPAGQERRAAPRRRRPWGRDPAARGAPAPPHAPVRVAPLPRREGAASPAPGAAQTQETPGVRGGGGAPPSFRARSARRERPQEGDRLPPRLAAPQRSRFQTRPFPLTRLSCV
ncbi:translation initiation factor IF-2-like [Lutra lutra]|uniref:translation initiation factor IF-2-like n=1 Tax=Lutra lutra TaxID=9657 RepID=UPI001FD083BA|nr:translation initiation factor IF-2-like [Lutra lutra]